MSLGRSGPLAAFAAFFLQVGAAWAQSAPTCSFDAPAARVTVTVRGIPAEIHTGSTGKIRLNGVLCGAATVTNTNTIQVNGTTSFNDSVTLSGVFAPGLTLEADAASEIEISIAVQGGDSVAINGTSGADRIVFSSGGIDVGDDGDQDISVPITGELLLDGGGGNDFIDARPYALDDLVIHGGDGNDRIYGSKLRDFMHGEGGDDTLYGLGGNDEIYPGQGNDVAHGGSGLDRFFAEPTFDGGDVFDGGSGTDRVSYAGRTAPVILTIDVPSADDGEAGEGDLIMTNVEDLLGGDGDDVLVGSSKANELIGQAGDDEIHGGAGDDIIRGVRGDDILFGDEGNDDVHGQAGADVLTGGPGTDLLIGFDGDDTIYNADGEADTVQCGNDTDDAEEDPLDTFSGCEL